MGSAALVCCGWCYRWALVKPAAWAASSEANQTSAIVRSYPPLPARTSGGRRDRRPPQLLAEGPDECGVNPAWPNEDPGGQLPGLAVWLAAGYPHGVRGLLSLARVLRCACRFGSGWPRRFHGSHAEGVLVSGGVTGRLGHWDSFWLSKPGQSRLGGSVSWGPRGCLCEPARRHAWTLTRPRRPGVNLPSRTLGRSLHNASSA